MQPDRTSELQSLLQQRLLVLDGAMGTMIQRHGLQEADYRGVRFADHPHDLKGKAGIALNQGEKMRTVNRGQQAIGPGYGAGHARLVVNQRHFAEDIARLEGFEQLLTGPDVDLTLDDNVERITWFTLLKNGLATGEGPVVFWRADRVGIALHETVPRRGAVRRDRRSQLGVSRTTIIVAV